MSELHSWMHPYSPSPLIGQVYFRTNDVHLRGDDRAALQRLADAFNDYGNAFRDDPFGILFLGHADPRPTTYPDGNLGLAQDRADACLDFFETKLTQAARASVAPHSQGRGFDPMLALVGLNQAQQRMVAVMRPLGPPLKKPWAPARTCAEAKEKCRRVLRVYPTWFGTEERRHLQHLCKDSTVKDGFLNGQDPKLVAIAYGIGGQMTNQGAERFANRFKTCKELMHPSAAGPDSDDLDVIGALKGLHTRIQQGIDHLVLGEVKRSQFNLPNQRLKALSRWVDRSRSDSRSVYFNW